MSNSNPANYESSYANTFKDRRTFLSPPLGVPPHHFDGGLAQRTLGYDGEPIRYDPADGERHQRGRSNYRHPADILTGLAAQAPQLVVDDDGSGYNTDFSRPNTRHHIPGYSGFTPGLKYRHGETYAKSTFRANDNPHALCKRN